MKYSVLVGLASSMLLAGTGRDARPTSAVDDLLSTDRRFASQAAHTDLVSALAAMFADNVVTPVPGTYWAEGKDAVVQSLRANADNEKSRAEWTPIRGGVSADGLQGFTFGYMTVHKADSTTVPIKYMAYWVKGANGWKVAAYKRARRPDSTFVITVMPPAEPARTVKPTTDATVIAAFESSLKAAEQAFSDEAQKIGLKAAFAKNGSADAVNMGGGATYVVGAPAIAASVGGAAPSTTSPVSWNADKVIVSSSGDLGITFGRIRNNANPSSITPFFTIWRRASPADPWRYVAE